jgi:methylenetetrahydrofolate dehydrogenase (NADP+)/methenyltetrahydrofolate cyclohydrolase
LPLPCQNKQKLLMAVDPSKDVDGFHPEFWKMALDMSTF